MIYFDKRGVAIMGEQGFIGNALNKGRNDLAPGIYFFDSPSSNILFDENIDCAMRKTINDFIEVLSYAKRNDVYVVYPSSATVYNKNTSYAHCKAICEELAAAYGVRSLGLRIAAGYGPGEEHKGRYASVVYQWLHQMRRGIAPVIYGDGTQTRDFIYEDDIAGTITAWAAQGMEGVHDLGTGVNTSFNEVVALINEQLGTNLDPVYVKKPANYVPETKINIAPWGVSLKDGIKIVDALS